MGIQVHNGRRFQLKSLRGEVPGYPQCFQMWFHHSAAGSKFLGSQNCVNGGEEELGAGGFGLDLFAVVIGEGFCDQFAVRAVILDSFGHDGDFHIIDDVFDSRLAAVPASRR